MTVPLAPALLTSELEQLFAAPPATYDGCASSWAAAIATYAADIVPASTTIEAAAGTLAAALAAAFAQPSSMDAMENAFTGFAASVATGMVGYTATPPVGPVGFAELFEGALPTTHAAAAQRLADLVHDWMVTGTSILVASPNTLVAWS